MSIDLVEAFNEAIVELQKEIVKDKYEKARAKADEKKYQNACKSSDTNNIKQTISSWQHPNALWRSKKATSKQINFICKLPYRGPIPYSRGQAHDIISKYCKSKLSTTIKNIERKFVTTVFHQSDDSGITIDDSDSNSENAPYSATEKVKLERQLWRESLG